jgi:primosomal protein N' (replication factor Y)
VEAGLSTVEVLPDSSGIDRAFHYLLPDSIGSVPIGTIVRVPLHGRRVRGWVVAAGTPVPDGVRPVPILAVVSVGPPAEVVELCRWAAWRYAGRLRPFLLAASPPTIVKGLPPPGGLRSGPAARPVDAAEREQVARVVAEGLSAGEAVLRLPPGLPRLDAVWAFLEQVTVVEGGEGDPYILTETRHDAVTVTRHLRARGYPVALQPEDWAAAAAGGRVVVGTRNAVFAPASPAAILVLDAHSEAYRTERAPTFDATVIAAERAVRWRATVGTSEPATAPAALFCSPCPPVELTQGRPLSSLDAPAERAGWPRLVTLDSRQEDPHDGGYPPELVSLIRGAVADGGGRPVVLVLNRKGRARLLSCPICRSVQRCPECGSALAQLAKPAKGEVARLSCPRCGYAGPAICSECGAGHLRVARPGAARAAEEVEALLGIPVSEVGVETRAGEEELPLAPVLLGTEAVLRRVRGAALVGFLDFDSQLMAARFRAGEQAIVMLARAARLLGGRSTGRIVARTSLPDHPVLRAVAAGDPAAYFAEESARRRQLRLPPFTALARIDGEGASALAASIAPHAEVVPSGSGYLVRAGDAAALADAFEVAVTGASAGWGAFDVRVEVDPLDL